MTKAETVNKILAQVRDEVLRILDNDPDIDLAFEGAQENAESALNLYRKGSIPQFRLLDGARDMTLALACLSLGIKSSRSPGKRVEVLSL